MIMFVCLTGQAVACVQTSPHPLKKIGKRFREAVGLRVYNFAEFRIARDSHEDSQEKCDLNLISKCSVLFNSLLSSSALN